MKVPGVGDGDRTRVASLEGWGSTIELHRRVVQGADTARSLRCRSFPAAKEVLMRRGYGFPRVEPPAGLEPATC